MECCTKKKIQVPIPQLLQTYNKHMGGVGLFDQFMSQYQIRIHSKKWQWPLFSWGNLSSHRKPVEIIQIDGTWHVIAAGHLWMFSEVIRKFWWNTFHWCRKAFRPSNKPICTTEIWLTRSLALKKSDQQYGRCKKYGRRSIYRCEKCQVSLPPYMSQDLSYCSISEIKHI